MFGRGDDCSALASNGLFGGLRSGTLLTMPVQLRPWQGLQCSWVLGSASRYDVGLVCPTARIATLCEWPASDRSAFNAYRLNALRAAGPLLHYARSKAVLFWGSSAASW